MNAYLLSLNPDANIADQWDFGFLKDFLEGELWRTPDWKDFTFKSVDKLPKDDRAIVVIPARHHAGKESELNHEFSKIDHIVLFCMGDEEADLDPDKLEAEHIWVQNPHPGKHDNYNRIGTGYPPQLHKHTAEHYPDKTVDIFFSGQLTHRRRHDMNENLVEWQSQGNSADIRATKGFTQGYSHDEYYNRLSAARLAPAPAGAVIPDSFRLFEALECMCIPLADNRNTQGNISDYWQWLFSDNPPFPLIDEWDELVGLSYRVLKDMYPRLLHEQTAWWINYKRDFAYKVMGQLNGKK